MATEQIFPPRRKEPKSSEQKLKELRKALRLIINYPPKNHDRRTTNGYPTEFEYDEFAYNRMVDSYREGINDAIKESLKKK